MLEGRKYTTTADAEYFKQTGETDPLPKEGFVDQKVVRDGNIVTSVGYSFVDFACEIADYLGVITEPGGKEKWAAALKGL